MTTLEIIGTQNTSPADGLVDHPLVKQYKPSPVGQYVCFSKYDETRCYQWFTSKKGGIWLPHGPIFTELEPEPASNKKPRTMETQKNEFDKLSQLCEQMRRLNLTCVVDDDYPAVRGSYERALTNFIDALRENQRL